MKKDSIEVNFIVNNIKGKIKNTNIKYFRFQDLNNFNLFSKLIIVKEDNEEEKIINKEIYKTKEFIKEINEENKKKNHILYKSNFILIENNLKNLISDKIIKYFNKNYEKVIFYNKEEEKELIEKKSKLIPLYIRQNGVISISFKEFKIEDIFKLIKDIIKNFKKEEKITKVKLIKINYKIGRTNSINYEE